MVAAALAEDLGDAGDITSLATVPVNDECVAHIVARGSGCIAGLGPALRVFTLTDSSVGTGALVTDGDLVSPDDRLASITGRTRAILSGERVSLNLLGHLSGIATATRAFVDRVKGTGAAIVDTRKTTPLFRALEKMAVRAGGGHNHRMGLNDAILIKDNHIRAVGSVKEAVTRARDSVGADVKIEVEIEDLDDLRGAVAAGANTVMLDNMEPDIMRRAVKQAAGSCVLEASGGITLDNVREIAETGVDLISIGWITHSAPVLDLALDFD